MNSELRPGYYYELLPKVDGRSALEISDPFTVWGNKLGVTMKYDPNALRSADRFSQPTVIEYGHTKGGKEIFVATEYPKDEKENKSRDPTIEEVLTILLVTRDIDDLNPMIVDGLRVRVLNQITQLEEKSPEESEKIMVLSMLFLKALPKSTLQS